MKDKKIKITYGVSKRTNTKSASKIRIESLSPVTMKINDVRCHSKNY